MKAKMNNSLIRLHPLYREISMAKKIIIHLISIMYMHPQFPLLTSIMLTQQVPLTLSIMNQAKFRRITTKMVIRTHINIPEHNKMIWNKGECLYDFLKN